MQITRHGEPNQTVGTPPAVGTALPEFSLIGPDGASVKSTDLTGALTLISVVPDINTRVCSIQTKHFNTDMDQFDGIKFYTVSTNTVEQQADWCAAEGVKKMQLLSDDAHDFGHAMQLLVPSNGTLQRSIFIIDASGVIQYEELIVEQTDEPDYAAALDFLKLHK